MSNHKKGKGAAIDERFARITYDPSFKSMKKDQKKVKIDKRFSGVFTDKKFKVVAKTDKYGNKLEVDEGINKEMEEFYYRDEEESQDISEQEDSSEQNEDSEEVKPKKNSKKDQKKNKINEQVSSTKNKTKKQSKKQQSEEDSDNNDDLKQDEDNSEDYEDLSDEENEHEGSFEWNEVSSSDEDIEFQDEEDNQEEFYYGVNQEKAPLSESSSSKLALINYDWMNINAQDLMLLFNSFKDKVGVIKRVLVYPSEFGLQQLEQENTEGPKNIWKKQEENKYDIESEDEQPSKREKKNKNANKNQNQNQKKSKKFEEDDEFDQESTQKMNKRQKKSLFESRKVNLLNHTVTARLDDDQGDLDPVALRQYERNRMRYYYAVIECDKKLTAEKIYESCDGMEFEMSGIPIDLRFVPEGQEFPYEPKEVCDEVPADSQVKNIINRSIGHTNTRLTWDQPVDRFKFLDGKMDEKEYSKIDWSKYVAAGDEDENDEDELKESNEELDLEDLNSDEEIAALEQEALKQQQEIDNMNWKQSFDKKNRKKKENEIEIKFNQGFDDLGNKILEKQKRMNETKYETQERLEKDKRKERKAQIKEKMKQHKNKKFGKNNEVEDSAEVKKNKAQLSLLVDKEEKRNDMVDLTDPRFKAIYETNDYAIDPTSKYYNKEHSAKVFEEQIKQRKKRKLNEEQ